MRKTKKAGPPVGALEYWQRHGREHCEALALKAGTTYDYWKRICNQRTRPGIDLARRLAELSGGEMTVETLCIPRARVRAAGAPPIPGGYRVGAVPKIRSVAQAA